MEVRGVKLKSYPTVCEICRRPLGDEVKVPGLDKKVQVRT
ncbi:unnamed protein product, partial [marine sediment metagenome]